MKRLKTRDERLGAMKVRALVFLAGVLICFVLWSVVDRPSVYSVEEDQEEMLIRGYLIGDYEPNELVGLLQENADGQMSSLQESPFESALLKPEDELWEWVNPLSEVLRRPVVVRHVVYNRTSGRLIVQGDARAQRKYFYMVSKLLDGKREPARMTFRFYRAALEGGLPPEFKAEEWNSREPEGEIVLSGWPSREMKAQITDPDLSLSWKIDHMHHDVVEGSLNLKGSIGGQSYDLSAHIKALGFVPALVELGRVGESEDTLILWIYAEMGFGGGINRLNRVCDEDGDLLPVPPSIGEIEPPPIPEIKKENGKGFAVFSVPGQGFLQFLGGDLGDSRFPLISTDDPRVTTLPGERLVSMHPLLKLQIPGWDESNIALINVDANLLFVEVPLDDFLLVNRITQARTWSPPLQMSGTIALVESDEQIEVDDLSKPGLRTLFRGPIFGALGHSRFVRLGFEETKVEYHTEINGGGSEVYDLQMQCSYRVGEESELDLEISFTMINNRPSILHSHFDGEKWRSLVMTWNCEILSEWL